MRIPFDIKYRPQIESGEYKVETRDGKKVRVLCYDANNIVPVVALVTFNDGSEGSRDYYSNGSMNFDRENALDLFVVTPEEELTEFEKAFDNLAELYHSDKNPDDVACCKEYAAELLALARKELEPEVLKRLDEAYKNQDEVVYEHGKRDGKAEAMKDLPRWREWGYGACGNGDGSPLALVYRFGEFRLVSSLGIEGEKYIMLGDIEELPGFKEDEI